MDSRKTKCGAANGCGPIGIERLETRRLLSADPLEAAAGAFAGHAVGGPDDFDVTASARSNTIADPRGDFLPTYTGVVEAGMDVVAHQVTLAGDRVICFGQMAGPVAPTEDIGGLYLFGVDRGRGTPRFLSAASGPPIGPNVKWDLIVRVNPDGTGQVNNNLLNKITPLDPADIRISGNTFVASVPLSLMTPAATRPPEQWTYNLWPRDGIGRTVQVSDLAPDDGNAPMQVLARDGSPGYGQEQQAAAALPRQEVAASSGGVVAEASGGLFPDAARIADEVLGGDGDRGGPDLLS